METTVKVQVNATPDVVFEDLSDLSIFTELIPIVHSAEPKIENGQRVWNIELRAKIGPFARSKMLRMVREICAPPEQVVYVRNENDGREHAAWVLGVDVTPSGAGSEVSIGLAYGGRLWTAGVLEKILRDNIEEGTRRLKARYQ